MLWIGLHCLPAGAGEVLPAAAGLPEHQVLVMLHIPPPHYRPDVNYAGRYGDDGAHAARRRIAEELARANGLMLVNDWPMPALGIDCYVMEDPGGGSSAHWVELLSRDPRIEWAQPMSRFHTLGNDPLYSLQPSAKYWHLDDLHRFATGRNVLVAVVDSGVEDQHPDLAGQVAVKQNFVDGNPYAAEQHGTAVAGIIAARGGNGVGVEGMAPGARLMALRACWQEAGVGAECSSFTLAKAMNFAIMHDVQIINLSLGGPPDRLLQRLLDAAMQNGIKVVAAVDPQRTDGGFPASVPGVLSVADQESGVLPGAFGRRVLLAPGRDIPTTAPGARWSFVTGTSYAAAHVSGMVALLTELRPSLSSAQMREQMTVIGPANDGYAGAIDACATIGRITGNFPCLSATAYASKPAHSP
jgi:hypothetical protein